MVIQEVLLWVAAGFIFLLLLTSLLRISDLRPPPRRPSQRRGGHRVDVATD